MVSDINLLGPVVKEKGFSFYGINGYSVNGAVSGAGDINGDGYDDFIIGVPFAYSGDNPGISYVIFGQINNLFDTYLPNLELTNGFSITGINSDWSNFVA